MGDKEKKSFNLLKFLFRCKIGLLIIPANIAAFIYLQLMPENKELFETLVLTPDNVFSGRYWCFITSGFIHGSWQHLLMNMLGVFVFARVVEKGMGITKALLIYFGALLISMFFAFCAYLFILQKPVAIIGASGAVMGLVSAAMLLKPFKVTWEMIVPLPIMMKGWLFLALDVKGLLGGEQDGVSHLAHLFGFISIALMVYFFNDRDKKKLLRGIVVNIFSFLVFAGIGIYLARQHTQILESIPISF